jgi:hypothetical protein
MIAERRLIIRFTAQAHAADPGTPLMLSQITSNLYRFLAGCQVSFISLVKTRLMRRLIAFWLP